MELDFTQPDTQGEPYDPAVARKCFQTLGKQEFFSEKEKVFVEDQVSDKIYLVLEGEVSLIRNNKTIDIVKAGEIFGELALITQQPRAASAVARELCKVLVLDVRQFQQAIQATPEFALMLMNIMIHRLRLTMALLKQTASLPSLDDRDELKVFDKKMMADLVATFRARSPQTFPAGRMIMKEGDAGASMYIVISGKVSVSINSIPVAQVGPGGMIGEMALVDHAPRAASAIAYTECQLLSITRSEFLNLVKTKPAFAILILKTIGDRLRNMSAQKKWR